MTDLELLSKVLEKHGFQHPDARRNEYETDIELAARIFDVMATFLNENVGVLDLLAFTHDLVTSRESAEWRSEELL